MGAALGWIADFFATFQGKDWVTFGLGLTGSLGTIAALVAGHMRHQQLLLKDQADFEANWFSNPERTVVWLELKNIGMAAARHVATSLDGDPGNILGAQGRTEGPIMPGETWPVVTSIPAAHFADVGLPYESMRAEGAGVAVEWTDDFGVRRRKHFTHGAIPRNQASSGWQPGEVVEGRHISRGGTTTLFDPRWPSFRGRWRPR